MVIENRRRCRLEVVYGIVLAHAYRFEAIEPPLRHDVHGQDLYVVVLEMHLDSFDVRGNGAPVLQPPIGIHYKFGRHGDVDVEIKGFHGIDPFYCAI